ncbi:hypothetical protein BH23BAC1_BH23BAC1_21040 [soil metagenome]
MKRIINLVDNILPENSGIWKAAISTSEILQKKHGYVSQIWFPEVGILTQNTDHLYTDHLCKFVPLHVLKTQTLKALISKEGISPNESIIISHGCWQFPTRWGSRFKDLGFNWIYVPQGMLEPWSMKQKKWKKKLYYSLYERSSSKKADLVRAVSTPEKANLDINYNNTILIPNGVRIPHTEVLSSKLNQPIIILFMGRLHHKKGILHLVRAWIQSDLNNNPEFILAIAGPDQGELQPVKEYMKNSSNIEYLNSLSGKAKELILAQSTYFILPSFSEGFPSAVIEAMSYGCIPIISEGCNFPESINNNLALKISTEIKSIKDALNTIPSMENEKVEKLAALNYKFIAENYSIDKIADLQHHTYNNLITSFNGKLAR